MSFTDGGELDYFRAGRPFITLNAANCDYDYWRAGRPIVPAGTSVPITSTVTATRKARSAAATAATFNNVAVAAVRAKRTAVGAAAIRFASTVTGTRKKRSAAATVLVTFGATVAATRKARSALGALDSKNVVMVAAIRAKRTAAASVGLFLTFSVAALRRARQSRARGVGPPPVGFQAGLYPGLPELVATAVTSVPSVGVADALVASAGASYGLGLP